MISLPIYQNYKFFYEIDLEENMAFNFSFEYSEFCNTFLISMQKDDEYIFYNLALVPGIDFLQSSGIGELGILSLVDNAKISQENPTQIEDFKKRFSLIYISKKEVQDEIV